MRHPFDSVPATDALRWLTTLFVASVALAIILSIIGPRGMVSLELAGTASRANAVIGSGGWTASRLRLQLTVDFIFIVAYSMCFSFACVAGSRGFGGKP